ncbi:hypothetical protein ACFSQE_11165 [Vogesella fluminis]|uniref:hypothetical protein n=1 Tax=Vogesella fluminis TaxID=1069161 RepID=UPI0036275A19
MTTAARSASGTVLSAVDSVAMKNRHCRSFGHEAHGKHGEKIMATATTRAAGAVLFPCFPWILWQ